MDFSDERSLESNEKWLYNLPHLEDDEEKLKQEKRVKILTQNKLLIASIISIDKIWKYFLQTKNRVRQIVPLLY